MSVAPRASFATDDEDEEPELRAGLIGHYEAGGIECARRDEAVQFVWGRHSPDERLPVGGFTAQWHGQVLVLSPGRHRFHVYAAGDVALKIDGQTLIEANSDTPRWFDSSPIDLEFGHHRIVIEYRKKTDAARLGLYWSGTQFELEPVPSRLLFHEPADAPGDAFERGAELWRALRCGNCHHRSDDVTGVRAPSLAGLSGNLSRDWMIDWLVGKDSSATTDDAPSRRMPHFELSNAEAQVVADFLLDTDHSRQSPDPRSAGDPHRGKRLFVTLGCLGCHQVGEFGSSGLFGGGDLSHIADKRPTDFFARWLRDPSGINADQRMPVFRLSDAESNDLAAWLATLGSTQDHKVAPNRTQRGVEQGRKLVDSLRCGRCHALPAQAEKHAEKEASTIPATLDLSRAEQNWQDTCLGEADRRRSRPGYDLSRSQREALVAYLRGLRELPPSPSTDGRFVLRERNCLGCHARDSAMGIAAQLTTLVDREAELQPNLPLLAPPALTGVGDKLHDAALADAITLRNPPLRPWLSVRMPRFDLTNAERAALIDYFATIDRIPDRPKGEPRLEAKVLIAAGSRLVTAAGFGCTSCHQIGHSLPSNVALAAHGTDLSLIGKRIRRPWFDRWVRNPARIVPRMEMPAIQVPARGSLGDKLDAQLAAVWHVLNTPGFEPPLVGPIRIARHPGDGTPPIVITDVVEADRAVIVRPILIGLGNRHNILFDLGGNRLVGWWLGDTANQQTRGKSWYWEPAGADLLHNDNALPPELELLHGNRRLDPSAVVGSALAESDWLTTEDDSVVCVYRTKFAHEGKTVELQVTQRITSASPTKADRSQDPLSGFCRQWEVSGVPAGHTLRLRTLPAGQHGEVEGTHTLAVRGHGAEFKIVVDSPPAATITLDRDGSASIELPANESGGVLTCQLRYMTTAVAPPAAAPAAAQPAESPAHLAIVPGYEAVRLPLPRTEMPTGLAWRDDGTLTFCSLKGSVWRCLDTDGDSVEDRLQLVADGLAAPYGLACTGDAIDVAAKYGVVRLSRFDAIGRARRTDVIASGWGYTADYHDWTIGLPRDTTGNYYIGLPCQQDQRSSPEALLRGTVVKLRPRKPTTDSPRLFDLEPIAAGLRFPMGLAIDRDGELFVTDNQGNYNPFNELNHIRRGARYGFINKLEARPDFHPPDDGSAVAIPHPWTRSVNGICFLSSPADVEAGRFGPFEGHLIGCEFDTRRLIRMSLEKIGDVYQGAAYPFTVEPAAGEPTFEGPVVCAVSPQGDLYVGNLRDSGWGGGQNTGSIVRLRPQGPLPVGIAEIHARSDGFSIDFTHPVDTARADKLANYSIVSFRRIATPAYGGTDVERENESINGVELSTDKRSVSLHLRRMRPGFVYEFQLKNLAGGDQEFFPAEAYYTLRSAPAE
ncbi:MAG TPA: c-type cytochrome [Pirellulales bacterium]|nr:c-type cytochrome [Pirellulales bacterium]